MYDIPLASLPPWYGSAGTLRRKTQISYRRHIKGNHVFPKKIWILAKKKNPTPSSRAEAKLIGERKGQIWNTKKLKISVLPFFTCIKFIWRIKKKKNSRGWSNYPITPDTPTWNPPRDKVRRAKRRKREFVIRKWISWKSTELYRTNCVNPIYHRHVSVQIYHEKKIKRYVKS